MRYLNAHVVPTVGDIWVYTSDAESGEGEEGPQEYKILAVDEDERRVQLLKLTGAEANVHKTMYLLENITTNAVEKWACKSGGKIDNLLWNCPQCGSPRPVPEGDYMCIDCRANIDAS